MTSMRPVAITYVVNAHAMRSIGKSGFQQPVDRLNLQASVFISIAQVCSHNYSGCKLEISHAG
jgi:hypothetical protein